ncbi:Crp/Fnr family transcriptional regulator [Mangrovicella endophytica]|uniref:Crp/Fnr family transcriptional regulator n=1 Tax=Mangrovicella endophytica TaxID=2066697 RepID=UPI000C9E8767|nr:Crp/Fnr family transcriptional regulator [Mangrovicella endophytica]
MGQASDTGAASMLMRHLGNFMDVTERESEAIAAALAGPVLAAGARTDLMTEGEAPRAVLLIVSGWACRYKMLEDGRRQIVAILLPGDLCDLNNGVLAQMDHSIGTLTPVRYVEISSEVLQRLAADHPKIGQGLWWQLLVNVAIQREWTVNVGRRSAVERIGCLFCELLLRLQAVGLAGEDGYPFPLTQTELAEATGLTSVHVNRTLQTMRNSGLIRLADRTLSIPDLTALQDIALFSPDYLHLNEKERRSGKGVTRLGT